MLIRYDNKKTVMKNKRKKEKKERNKKKIKTFQKI